MAAHAGRNRRAHHRFPGMAQPHSNIVPDIGRTNCLCRNPASLSPPRRYHSRIPSSRYNRVKPHAPPYPRTKSRAFDWKYRLQKVSGRKLFFSRRTSLSLPDSCSLSRPILLKQLFRTPPDPSKQFARLFIPTGVCLHQPAFLITQLIMQRHIFCQKEEDEFQHTVLSVYSGEALPVVLLQHHHLPRPYCIDYSIRHIP